MSVRTIKMVAILWGIPLLLVVWSMVQMGRTSAMADERASLQAQLQVLEAAPPPTAASRDFKALNMSRGQQMNARMTLKTALDKTDPAAPAVVARQALPYWTLGLALMGVLVGTAALVFVLRVDRAADASRSELVRVFSQGHKRLPWFMLALTGLFALAGASAVAYEALVPVHTRMVDKELRWSIVGGLLVLGILGVAARALWVQYQSSALFADQPLVVQGRQLTVAQAPGLWRWVQGLTSQLQAQVPDHIVVGLCDGFFVTSSPTAVTSADQVQMLSGRTLYLPLTYLSLLDQQEVEAIVGHELAHFAGQDTEYSMQFLPIYAGITRQLTWVENTSERDFINAIFLRPALFMARHFAQVFDHAVKKESRERELVADKTGARLSGGARAAASALIRSSVLHQPIQEAVARSRLQSGESAQQADLVREVTQALAEHGMEDPAAHLEDVAIHPTDTHPPTRLRIEALSVAISPDLLAHATRPVQDADHAWWNELVPGALALRQLLTSDLHALELGHLQQRRAGLEDELVIYQGSMKAVWMYRVLAGASVLVLLWLVGLALWTPHESLANNVKLTAFSVLAALGCFVAARRENKKQEAPLLVVRRNEIVVQGMPRAVAWTDIASVRVCDDYAMSLHLILKTPAAEVGSAPPASVSFYENRTQVVVDIPPVKGKPPSALADMFHEYHALAAVANIG
jgi:Zn-dependent protease with chaperone function